MASGTRSSAGLPPAAPERPPCGWTAGRVAAAVAGAVLALVSLGLLGGGAAMMWADQAMRDDGYLTTGISTYSTSGYALASQPLELGWGWLVTGLIGDVRVRVTPVQPWAAWCSSPSAQPTRSWPTCPVSPMRP